MNNDRKLAEVSKRIQAGLDSIKSWPIRTPAKAVLGHASALVFAAQETIEAKGDCMHHVVLLGESQTRLNMLSMTGGETREERQAQKVAVWTRVAQLFSLLDADVMLWLQDAWYNEISPEELESGDWEWPSDTPNPKEALHLSVITPTQQALLVCPYARRENGTVHWSNFEKASSGGGQFEDAILGTLVQKFRHLRPMEVFDGQRRLKASFGSHLMPAAKVITELEEMGQIVAHVDSRFLNLN